MKKHKKLVIHVLANDGSPIGVTEQSIYGHDGRSGVGGAELAILTLCRGWHDAGHEVIFYNNPQVPNGSAFKQLPMSFFIPHEQRDILVVFRSPNERIRRATGKKIWFSTDQYTVGDFREFSNKVDRIVTISPFHAKYFEKTYGIYGTKTIDLPVRLWEYEKEVEKKKHSLIFCSVPDRGLTILADVYDELKSKIPDLSLAITSDYRLWGNGSPLNEQFIRKFYGKDGVRFLGAVSREQLVDEQLAAEIHAFPCTYEELFCYASAECQVAGAYPITPTIGALETTNMGIQLEGNPISQEWKRQFIDEIVATFANREAMQAFAKDNKQKAIERFSLERILKEWDEVFYE